MPLPPPADANPPENRPVAPLTFRRWASQAIPSGIVSTTVHLLVLLLLALLSVTSRTEPPLFTLVSSSDPAAEEEVFLELPSSVELPDVDREMAAQAILAEASEPVTLDSLVDAAPFDPAPLAIDVGLAGAISLLERDLTDAALAATLDSEPSGSSRTPGGKGGGKAVGTTSVFGVKSTGNRFVYVIDNSNSMVRGRLEAAILEVQSSVEKLKPTQQFYVVFYSDAAYPLLYPKAVSTYLPATQANKYRLRDWLATIEHCLHTNGQDALALAFDLQPDVIYLLGDGAFTDGTVKQTLKRTNSHVVIHTFGFDMKKAGAKDGMESIARQFRGDFHDVTVPPEMVALDRQTRRPLNRIRHGVWGIKLPAERVNVPQP